MRNLGTKRGKLKSFFYFIKRFPHETQTYYLVVPFLSTSLSGYTAIGVMRGLLNRIRSWKRTDPINHPRLSGHYTGR